MARPLELDEMVDHFTLGPDELKLLHGKAGATRPGFGAILKFLIWSGRFPVTAGELPDNAIGYVARQVDVPAADIDSTTGPDGRSSAVGWRFAGRSASGSAASPRPRS